MNDPQTASPDEQPTKTAQPGDGGDDGNPRRRLMSLSSQKRRPQERTAKTKDSKPPEDDPMARALELLSGIDENVRDAEQPGGEVTDGTQGADSPSGAGLDAVVVDRESAEAAESTEGGDEAPEGPTGSEEEAGEVRYEQVIRREDASPVVAKETKRNPAKALYSLQEVHERTGIPYATLALYAANHSERIPSLGERRSPAYPRQGLEEFCRIHAENNPDWERPAVGSEKGWDDQEGLARRIDALGDGLDDLHADVREIHAIVRRGWTAEVSLFD